MTPDDFIAGAARTECDQSRAASRMAGLLPFEISRELPGQSCTAITFNHGVLGMLNELGELGGILQKWIYYGRDYAPAELRAKVRDEAGDLLWHYTQILRAFGLTFEEVFETNQAKLRERYPDAFSAERALNRSAATYAAEDAAARAAGARPVGTAATPEQRRAPLSPGPPLEVTRKRSEVLRDRRTPYRGCCNRYHDQMACECLSEAVPDGPPCEGPHYWAYELPRPYRTCSRCGHYERVE